MTLAVRTDPVPLRTDEHGVVRVGTSQVLLDVVIREFNNGADPESLVYGYSTLDLADVYAVLPTTSGIGKRLRSTSNHAERRPCDSGKRSKRNNLTGPNCGRSCWPEKR